MTNNVISTLQSNHFNIQETKMCLDKSETHVVISKGTFLMSKIISNFNDDKKMFIQNFENLDTFDKKIITDIMSKF